MNQKHRALNTLMQDVEVSWLCHIWDNYLFPSYIWVNCPERKKFFFFKFITSFKYEMLHSTEIVKQALEMDGT